jgi:hypothetical protein
MLYLNDLGHMSSEEVGGCDKILGEVLVSVIGFLRVGVGLVNPARSGQERPRDRAV